MVYGASQLRQLQDAYSTRNSHPSDFGFLTTYSSDLSPAAVAVVVRVARGHWQGARTHTAHDFDVGNLSDGPDEGFWHCEFDCKRATLIAGAVSG